jgi:hypothetical protein
MSENDDPIDFLYGFFGHIRAFTGLGGTCGGLSTAHCAKMARLTLPGGGSVFPGGT